MEAHVVESIWLSIGYVNIKCWKAVLVEALLVEYWLYAVEYWKPNSLKKASWTDQPIWAKPSVCEKAGNCMTPASSSEEKRRTKKCVTFLGQKKL